MKDQLKYSELHGADEEEPGVKGPECVPLIPRPSSYTEGLLSKCEIAQIKVKFSVHGGG